MFRERGGSGRRARQARDILLPASKRAQFLHLSVMLQSQMLWAAISRISREDDAQEYRKVSRHRIA